MRQFDRELENLDQKGLRRQIRQLESAQETHITIGGKTYLNFASNDYLGFANHRVIKQASTKATDHYGAGSGASRLICGSLPPHRELEQAAAQFLETDSALGFANGYTAALGTLGAILQKGDVVILDKLCHACLIDGARLSEATLRVFPHNRIDKLQSLLFWAKKQVNPDTARILVVTESIFSMDGDYARLSKIAQLTQESDALLLVDEAHALGVLGPQGKGLVKELDLTDQVDFRMATLGKSAGAAGGIVAGKRDAIELIQNRARSLIFSTSPPPGQAAAATAGLALVSSTAGEERRSVLQSHLDQIFKSLPQLAPQKSPETLPHTAILPVPIGDEVEALALSQRLQEEGLLCPAIRYPTVARGSARLRVTLSAAHKAEEIEILISHLRRAIRR